MLLTDILQAFYSDMGQTDPIIGSFVATGGSATTFINTDWANFDNPPEEDSLKNRYAFVSATTDGLTPQGKWSKVSAYVDSTQTATIATVTDAIGAGDTIMLPKQDLFPLQILVDRVNRALTNLGEIPLVDTSLTTEANKTEYALPTAAKKKLIAVYMQGQTTDANDNQWEVVSNWRIDPTAAGTTGLLILPQLSAGYSLKLVYMGIHPKVTLYSDYISEYIHPKIVVLATIVEALSWYNNRDENQGANEYFTWLVGEKKNELAQAKMEYPIWKPARSPKWFIEHQPITDTVPDAIT